MNHLFYTVDLPKETQENNNFRKVAWTGKYMQMVYMSLLAGEEISKEIHDHSDQLLRIEEGSAKAIVDDIEYLLDTGSTIIIPSGSEHTIINTGEGLLKISTLYAPPHHLNDRVHATKLDAENDTENEEYGDLVYVIEQ